LFPLQPHVDGKPSKFHRWSPHRWWWTRHVRFVIIPSKTNILIIVVFNWTSLFTNGLWNNGLKPLKP
jgi:hypothetical protein